MNKEKCVVCYKASPVGFFKMSYHGKPICEECANKILIEAIEKKMRKEKKDV